MKQKSKKISMTKQKGIVYNPHMPNDEVAYKIPTYPVKLTEMHTVGKRIKYYREKLGLEQKDIARQLGFTPTSSRQEIPSWVTMLASPYPASLGHLIFHPLRSAEGTLGLICCWQIPSRAQFLSGGNPHKSSLSLRV